jgi:hypothetical protein
MGTYYCSTAAAVRQAATKLKRGQLGTLANFEATQICEIFSAPQTRQPSMATHDICCSNTHTVDSPVTGIF